MVEVLKAVGIIEGNSESYKYKGSLGFQHFINQCRRETSAGAESGELLRPFKPRAVQPSSSAAACKKRQRPEMDLVAKENSSWESFKGEGAFKKVSAV